MSRASRRNPLEAAIAKVLDPATDRSTVRWAAKTLFDAGEFTLAATGFERLIDADPPDLDALANLAQITSDQHREDRFTALILRVLDERGTMLPPVIRFELMLALFDATQTPDAEAIRLLFETAVASGGSAWSSLLTPERRTRIERLLPDDATGLPILEHWLYAPINIGLPGIARSRLETLGCRFDTTAPLARDIERLLHLVGDVEAGYRVERCRRARQPDPASSTSTLEPPETSTSLPPIVVTIAGGHAALRSLVRRDLVSSGIAEVREVPSAWEGVRDSRAVAAVVNGSDFIVIVASQIAHSTSDQVRAVAERFHRPVAYADAASLRAIRRLVERYATSIQI